jgi:hypothetical protein
MNASAASVVRSSLMDRISNKRINCPISKNKIEHWNFQDACSATAGVAVLPIRFFLVLRSFWSGALTKSILQSRFKATMVAWSIFHYHTHAHTHTHNPTDLFRLNPMSCFCARLELNPTWDYATTTHTQASEHWSKRTEPKLQWARD